MRASAHPSAQGPSVRRIGAPATQRRKRASALFRATAQATAASALPEHRRSSPSLVEGRRRPRRRWKGCPPSSVAHAESARKAREQGIPACRRRSKGRSADSMRTTPALLGDYRSGTPTLNRSFVQRRPRARAADLILRRDAFGEAHHISTGGVPRPPSHVWRFSRPPRCFLFARSTRPAIGNVRPLRLYPMPKSIEPERWQRYWLLSRHLMPAQAAREAGISRKAEWSFRKGHPSSSGVKWWNNGGREWAQAQQRREAA